MSNGFLSQEEIDSLLKGDIITDKNSDELTDTEKDILGEVGNISMGTAATTLSQIINQPVNITTPVVSCTTFAEVKKSFNIPNLALEIEYIQGIEGKNLLVVKIPDAGVISNLMMGGDGKVKIDTLSEIEESAVSEAMNQMIGSAATSMATMFSREINISPPKTKVWYDKDSQFVKGIEENEIIVKISFRLTIGDLVDSNIMQILSLETGRRIASIMMGEEKQTVNDAPINNNAVNNIEKRQPEKTDNRTFQQVNSGSNFDRGEIYYQHPVEVQTANFQSLTNHDVKSVPKNIDLIMDVPLEISVVLGKTNKTIKEVLSLNSGSLIELNKLVEDPVEVLVNGKRVAFGEVVVVEENFGVRITSIVDSDERVRSLSK